MDSRADWNDEGIKCTDCGTWISASDQRRFHGRCRACHKRKRGKLPANDPSQLFLWAVADGEPDAPH